MSKVHLDGEEHQVTNEHETVKSYGAGRLSASPGDHVITFDDGALAFVCSHEQFERLFKRSHHKKH